MAATTKKAAESAETAETAKSENSTAETEKTLVQASETVAVQTSAETDVQKPTVAKKATPTYTAAEFAAASDKVFDKKYNPDIVTAAFKMAGKKKATKAEAAKIMSEFLNKEVKLK